jgi:hypothetical protein
VFSNHFYLGKWKSFLFRNITYFHAPVSKMKGVCIGCILFEDVDAVKIKFLGCQWLTPVVLAEIRKIVV